MIPASADFDPPSPKANISRVADHNRHERQPARDRPGERCGQIRHRIHPRRRALRQDRRLDHGPRWGRTTTRWSPRSAASCWASSGTSPGQSSGRCPSARRRRIRSGVRTAVGVAAKRRILVCSLRRGDSQPRPASLVRGSSRRIMTMRYPIRAYQSDQSSRLATSTAVPRPNTTRSRQDERNQPASCNRPTMRA